MSMYFDKKHKPIVLEGLAYLRLVKGIKIGYKLPNSISLSIIKLGPFKILEQVGDLAYKLKLLKHIRIYLVVSIIYLELGNKDEFNRKRLVVGRGPIKFMDSGEGMWPIEKIVRRVTKGDKDFYEIRWKGYK
jgi:hypothetical protein